jgi:hypothetical protein
MTISALSTRQCWRDWGPGNFYWQPSSTTATLSDETNKEATDYVNLIKKVTSQIRTTASNSSDFGASFLEDPLIQKPGDWAKNFNGDLATSISTFQRNQNDLDKQFNLPVESSFAHFIWGDKTADDLNAIVGKRNLANNLSINCGQDPRSRYSIGSANLQRINQEP